LPNKPDVKVHAELANERSRLDMRLRGFYEGCLSAYSDYAGGITVHQSLDTRIVADLLVNNYFEYKRNGLGVSFSGLNLFARTDQGLTYSYFDRRRVIDESRNRN